jgi:hypothetical protein
MGEPYPWLFAYFREVYPHRVERGAEGVYVVRLPGEPVLVEALHLAYTLDGRHWLPLNGNRPVLEVTPALPRLRDPFVCRGPDGWFHLVATSGERQSILYTRSADLIDWETPRSLPVMQAVPETVNAWAPEFVYDATRGDYLLFWSSSQARYGWEESRIWCARTPDFQALAAPRILFDPGYSVIDATIIPFEDRFAMFFKEEMFGESYGERRAVRLALSQRLDGEYEVVTEAITPVISEGPAAVRSPDREEWHLYYDRCMDDGYGLALSHDLRHWQHQTDVSFPSSARHGSVVPLRPAGLERLLHAYPAGTTPAYGQI